MRVVFLPEVLEYFQELSTILYKKGYFGFEDSALNYIDELFESIKETLQHRIKKPAPPYFEKFGKNLLYSTFRKNQTTEWYVFFNIYRDGENTTYVIRYLSNNHVVAKYL